MTRSIAHVAIYCSDVTKSTDFYTRVLGLRRLFTQKKPDGSLWYEYLYAGGGTFIELFPLDKAAQRGDVARPGVAHVCLAVDDIQESAQSVAREGWKLETPPKMGGDGNWQAWVVDPDGVRIELMQMMPDCLQYKAMKENGLS